MDTLLLAFALSGNLGLFDTEKGIIAEAVGGGDVSRNSYVSIQDDGLYVAYTDDSCRLDMKTKACAGATSLSILDTAGQEEVDGMAVGVSADGDLVAFTSADDPDHFSFQGGCQKGGGDLSACTHPEGYAADVHCFAVSSADIIGPERVANVQFHDSAAWDVLAKMQDSGRTSMSTLDETYACVRFQAETGAAVAATVTTLSIVYDAGDGFMDYVDDPGFRALAVGTVGIWTDDWLAPL